jgi:hypothetical protein
VHADASLPPEAGIHLKAVFECPDVAGGCFTVRFLERKPRLLGLVAAGINWRTRVTHSATGDQAIFVRRSVFEESDGFREWPLFEDVDFVSRMKRAGRFVVVHSRVGVSARRHIKYGVIRTVILVYLLRLGFWAGISPVTLARWSPVLAHNARPQAPLIAAPGRNPVSG